MPSHSILARRIARARSRLIRSHLLRWILWTSAALAFLALLMILLPGIGVHTAGRWLAGLLAIAAVGIPAYREVWLPHRRGVFGMANAALWAESGQRLLQDKLLSGFELEAETSGRIEASPELQREFVLQVSEISNRTPQGRLIPAGFYRKPASALGGLAVLWLAAALILGSRVPGRWGSWFVPLAGAVESNREGQMPSVVSDISVTYNYPLYTGLPSRRVPVSDGTLSGLPGTRVEISALVKATERQRLQSPALVFLPENPSEAATSEAADTEPSEPLPGPVALSYDAETYRVTGAFVIKSAMRYEFRLDAGSSAPSRAYHMLVEEDRFPDLSWIDPTQDLSLDAGEPLSIQWKAGDDFGLGRLNLVWERVSGQGAGLDEQRVSVREFKPGVDDDVDGHTVDLKALGLGAGDRVEVYLEASDNDDVSGPKWTQTPRILITIQSEAEKRKALAELVEALLESALRTLAADLVGPVSKSSDYVDLLRRHESVEGPYQETLTLFGSALSQLAEMPEMDLLTVTTLVNLAEETREVRGKLMRLVDPLLSQAQQIDEDPNAQSRRKLPDRERAALAAPNQAQTRQLEKDAIQLDALRRKLNMDNLLDEGRELREQQEDLQDLMDALQKNPDDEDLSRKMAELVAAIDRKMAEMMQKLAELTKSLPDDFINSDAFKEANLAEGQDLMKEMQEALKSGDLQKALEKAEAMMAAMDEMMAAMEEAASQFRDKTGNELERKFNEMMDKLEELRKDQSDLAASSEEVKRKAQQKAMENATEDQEDFWTKQIRRVEEIQAALETGTRELVETPEFQEYLDLQNKMQLLNETLQYRESLPSDQRPDLEALVRERTETIRQVSQRTAEGSVNDFFYGQRDWYSEKYELLRKLLAARDALGSLEAAQDALGRMGQAESGVNNLQASLPSGKRYGRLAGRLQQGRGLNEKIVEDLRNLHEQLAKNLSPEQKQMMEMLAQRQDQVRKDTDQLKQEMEKMREQVPMISSGTCDKLGGAGESMREAQGGMNAHNPASGAQHGRSAEQKLSEALGDLQQMMQGGGQPGGEQAGQPGQNPGMPMPFGFMPMPGGMGQQGPMGGRQGVARDNVRIVEDFKSPEEFRKALQEAMKEASPKAYEDLNKDYYKELVK